MIYTWNTHECALYNIVKIYNFYDFQIKTCKIICYEVNICVMCVLCDLPWKHYQPYSANTEYITII